MPWATPKGWNFRNTSGFITDGTNQTYALYNEFERYPISSRTIGGEAVTFGWVEAFSGSNMLGGADRSNTGGIDPRFAGVNYSPPGSFATFRVDLPEAGTYDIRIA